MADVRTALLDHLQSEDDATREALASTVEGVDLAQARIAAKDDPRSVEALATLAGAMLVAGESGPDIVDTVKAAAQRAPRDAEGTGVALLAGAVVWRLAAEAKAAEPYFRRVRRIEGAHPEVLAYYRALFGSEGADKQLLQQLIQVLVQARRATQDKQVRFDLASEVASIAEERLGSVDRAIEMWRSVIREDGSDKRALEALMRLYRESGKWTALVELLKDEIDQIEDTEHTVETRIERLLEVAGLYRDKLRMDTMALATLQRILELDPTHEASLEALSETYAKGKRWNDLLSIYERRVKAAADAGDAQRQSDLLRRVAEIWLDRLGNPQRALQPLNQVLELQPGDKEARQLLARIHEQRRDFRALIALRREELGELEGDEALQKRIELARLAEERLGDRREAIEAWNDVLANHGDVDQALAALARLYERENRWANAAEILHRKLMTCEREPAIRLLNHLGGLYDDRLHSRRDAMAVWEELLRLEPGHDKATRRLRDAYIAERRWDELTRLYEQQRRVPDLVEVLQSAADRIGDVDERVALYRRVASLCQTQLGQPERAVKALERTLAIQPDNLDVARELLPIYREQSNWARLMNTMEVLLGAAGSDEERLDLIEQLGQVAEQRLSSATLTLQWSREAYLLRPTDEGIRGRLESAAERADGWDELTRVYEQRLATEGLEDSERLELLGKLAVIARDRLFKPDDAQRYFRRIVEADPTNSDAMRALEEIYTSTRRWDDLSEIYRKRLDITDSDEDRLSTLQSLAQLQEQQLADLDGGNGDVPKDPRASSRRRARVGFAGPDSPGARKLERSCRRLGAAAQVRRVGKPARRADVRTRGDSGQSVADVRGRGRGVPRRASDRSASPLGRRRPRSGASGRPQHLVGCHAGAASVLPAG